MINLYDHQFKVIHQLKTGSILRGGVGSGKSITSVAYYYISNGGNIGSLMGGDYTEMNNPKDLYIITTALKRDKLEWDKELSIFGMSRDSNISLYNNKIVIDSWNNIKKYADVKDAFFIFDEQKLVGSGVWVKSFLKISKHNEWLLLTATPGDTWSDYIPVFIANGFYKNRTAFLKEHAVYSRYCNFPKIERYLGTKKLERLRDSILVEMIFNRHTEPHHKTIKVDYDIKKYKEVTKTRWNIYKDEPMQNAAVLCYVQRQIVNEHISRQSAILDLTEKHKKVIIFYNFDYELDILKKIPYSKTTKIAEYNGHKHEPVPVSNRWVYLVQYTAGCEGWNCTSTDTIIFFSQNYSYKVMTQAAGRIDRLNTPFIDLYYYHLRSDSKIDLAIKRAYDSKKKFNISKYIKW